jgi:hypothetical protein
MIRIRLALFDGSTQAEPIRQRLKDVGISAEVHDESGLAKLWYVPGRGAGARLEAPEAEAARAQQLLKEWDAQPGLLQSAIHCPECGSLRVEYPQVTHKSLFTNFAVGLAAELGLVEREYYCEDCHCMWGKQDAKPRRVRDHLAPDYFLEGVQHEPPPGMQVRRQEPAPPVP